MRDEANPTPPFEYGGRPVTFREHAQLRAEMNRKLERAYILICIADIAIMLVALPHIFGSG